MEIKGWGKTYKVIPEIEEYLNGNLAITLLDWDDEFGFWEPYGHVTVNFEEKMKDNDLAYVDIVNLPYIEEFISEYELGEPTGNFKVSGFCVYPEFKFNLDKIKEYTKERIEKNGE